LEMLESDYIVVWLKGNEANDRVSGQGFVSR